MKLFTLNVATIILFSGVLNAQFTHTFSETARNTHYGSVESVTGDSNGTIFIANGSGGLKAFNKTDTNLVFISQIDDDSSPYKVIIGQDGTIFTVGSNWRINDYRLSAYNFNGLSFTKKDEIVVPDYFTDIAIVNDSTIFAATDDMLIAYSFISGTFSKEPVAQISVDGHLNSIAVDSNGIVFTANLREMQAYHYHDSTFKNIASVNVNESGEEEDLTIGVDGTIFLTVDNYQDHTKLFAYKFIDSAFVYNTHIDVPGRRWSAGDVTVAPDGTVFLVKFLYGLIAYEYDGSSFKNSGYIDIKGSVEDMYISSNGDIFLANGGLSIYNFDGISFTKTAIQIRYSEANDVVTNNKGLVFLANGADGLRVYSYDGSSLLNIAHAYVDTGLASGVSLSPDETIFLANGTDGLRAYQLNESSLVNTAHVPFDSGYAQKVTTDANGTVFLVTEKELQAYDYNGVSFTKTAWTSIDSGLISDVTVVDDGTVFLAGNGWRNRGGFHTDDDGLRAYKYDGHSFTNKAHIDNDGWASGIALGLDGTVYLANGEDGIRVYNYFDTLFTNIAFTLVFNGWASDVAIGLDGNIFLADSDYESNSLFAYQYENNSILKNVAKSEDIGKANRVVVSADGTIFLATNDEGLIVYEYAEITSISHNSYSNPESFKLNQNYPNPFNPTTTIEYQLPKTSKIQLSIYNLLGQKVATLVNKKQSAGKYSVEWDATGFSSGLYFYKLETGSGFEQTRKLVVLK
ncbi:MAG: T9SS C-terminal target domain-containing protein [Calditrichaeota bacterium]|nr:MAG: T9SS C-terminal target domain-containing protein [Calditrichota bacterium]MBL1204130.1 T9SS C-terminal target domain-containing protein [Calditrichota bacterium]NOG43961.1 T9SS type A sorting domain-containing protein [Calditrichota bacterium]